METQLVTGKRRSRKSVVIAVGLQCIPLLAAAGCAANGVSSQSENTQNTACLLWLSVLLWGLGYAYIGQIKRFILAFVIGPVLAWTAAIASMAGAGIDYEHTWWPDATRDEIQRANWANLQVALLIAALVLMLAVDVIRCTAEQNAQVTSDE